MENSSLVITFTKNHVAFTKLVRPWAFQKRERRGKDTSVLVLFISAGEILPHTDSLTLHFCPPKTSIHSFIQKSSSFLILRAFHSQLLYSFSLSKIQEEIFFFLRTETIVRARSTSELLYIESD